MATDGAIVLSTSRPKMGRKEANWETSTVWNPKPFLWFVRFPTMRKEHFEDILDNRCKPENILKLSTSLTKIKPWVKYTKVGDSIELATHEDDSTAGEAKSITQLLRCFLLYGQIIIHFAPPTVQLELSTALAVYVDRLLGYSMV